MDKEEEGGEKEIRWQHPAAGGGREKKGVKVETKCSLRALVRAVLDSPIKAIPITPLHLTTAIAGKPLGSA